MNIEIINNECDEIVDALVQGVREYNGEKMDGEKSQPLTVTAHNDQGQLIAGVHGRTIYNQFLIHVAWVEKTHRKTGLGRQLMELAESEAKKRNCVAAQVDTLSFQAPDFYQRLGFEVVGLITGVPQSPDRFFLFKKYF